LVQVTLLGKRVHDVKDEPGGENGCGKTSKQDQKGREQEGLQRPGRVGRQKYERELARLHGELVKLQLWVVAKGLKVVVLFEGRDGAGKGGVIKAITERVSPRVYRVVALPAPTEREKSQMYVQRYMRHLPAAGEIVIFDRSWYNRANGHEDHSDSYRCCRSARRPITASRSATRSPVCAAATTPVSKVRIMR
jgi:polyphosphate kinase 2 (PPK2 family)